MQRKQSSSARSRRLLTFINQDRRPAWFTSAYEIGASLQKSNEIAGDHGELDLQLVFRLRNLVLHKLLKPMLSTVPGAGLQTLATCAQSSDQYSSILGLECVNVAMIVVYTVVDSLVIYPNPAFLEYAHQLFISG
jgi:hypothetical protein